MNKKIIILLIVCFFNANQSFSHNVLQSAAPKDSVSSGITNAMSTFIEWIKKIDIVLSGIENKETLNALYRNLGYTSLYIDEIAYEKLLLANEISDLKNDKDDNKHIPSLSNRVDQITTSIYNLDKYLKELKDLLSQTDKNEIDNIVLQIEQGFEYRKLYLLKDIKDAIYKKNIPYDRILQEAQESKKIADTASIEIKKAKDKIIEKLQK